jgi:hypothetical protein
MVSVGGGGGGPGLPMGSPFEVLLTVVVLVSIGWLAYKVLS